MAVIDGTAAFEKRKFADNSKLNIVKHGVYTTMSPTWTESTTTIFCMPVQSGCSYRITLGYKENTFDQVSKTIIFSPYRSTL